MAATAAAAATTSVHGLRDFQTVAVLPKIGYVNIPRLARSRFCICSGSEADEITTATATTTTTSETDGESTVEVQEEPESFISALNAEKAIRGIRINFNSL